MIGSGGVAPPLGAERDGGKSTVQHLAALPWVPAGVTKQIWETNFPAGVGIKTKRQK